MNQRKAGVLLSYFNKVMSIGINLVYVPLLLFYMGTHEYGLYQLMGSVVAYIGLMDFGFSVTITRFYSEYKALKDTVRMENLLATAAVIYAILGVIILTVGGTVYFFLDDIFVDSLTAVELLSAHKIYILLILGVLICVETQIFTAVIISEEKFIVQKLINTMFVLCQPVAVLLVMQVSPYAYSFVLIQTTFYGISTAIQIVYAIKCLHMRVKFHGLDKRMVRSITGFSMTLFIVFAMEQVFFRSNQVVLGIMSGTAAVAVYAIGAQVYMSYMPLATTISGVFFPKVTQMAATKRPVEEFSNLFIRIGRLQFLLLGLVLSGFILFGQRFMHFWVGDNFLDAYWVALLVIGPYTLDIIQSLGPTIMQARNDFSFKAKVSVVTGILNIAFAIPAAHYWGGIGCAFVTGVLVLTGNCIAMDIYYIKILHLDILGFWKNIARMAMFVGIAMALEYAIEPVIALIGISGLHEFVLLIIGYIMLYLLIIGRFVLNPYEKNLCREGLKRIHFKKISA